MVSTSDSDSGNLGSIPGTTFCFAARPMIARNTVFDAYIVYHRAPLWVTDMGHSVQLSYIETERHPDAWRGAAGAGRFSLSSLGNAR
jgi:hypothetical protein